MSTNNNINKKNLNPFISNKVINGGIDNDKLKTYINDLPKIPGILFDDLQPGTPSPSASGASATSASATSASATSATGTTTASNGSKIINKYYKIKFLLNKLDVIKKFMLSILKPNENDKEFTKKISISKYSLIQNFDMIFEGNDDFEKFIKKFIKEKYNIFKNINKDVPFFFHIFQLEYLGKSKDFFLDLFRKYIEIRKKILLYIGRLTDTSELTDTSCYGLIAFESFFELENAFKFRNKKNELKNSIISSNKNNSNNYIIYNNPTTPTVSTVSTTTPEIPSLYPKIHKYNLLYNSCVNKDTIKTNYDKNITDIYKNFDNYINNTKNASNLYSIISNGIELDFYTIKLIFTYQETDKFNKLIDIHDYIKKTISESINTFESYYEIYLDWFNEKGSSSTALNDYNKDLSDFNTFYYIELAKILPR